VTTGYVFIPAFVVPGDAGHELLSIRFAPGLHFGEELNRSCSAKRGCQTSAVQYLDFTSLSLTEGEAEVVALWVGHLVPLCFNEKVKLTGARSGYLCDPLEAHELTRSALNQLERKLGLYQREVVEFALSLSIIAEEAQVSKKNFIRRLQRGCCL
jgi:hypothetical protein